MNNRYSRYTPEQLEEHLSNFLVDSWSYSKVACFARNEKDFERTYIYREPSRFAASSVAGNAYHKALEFFFGKLKETGMRMMPSLPDLELEAYAYIDNVGANEWKLQKTTPTVSGCISSANTTVSALLRNFYGERDLYLEEVSEIIAVECRFNEWLSVNGVDIPLPCHGVIDLVVRLNDGRIVIIDHKSKGVYSNGADIALVHGKQAVTYVLGYESMTGLTADEVWFVENKHSLNKDKSPQMRRFVIAIDPDGRRLYEAMLYEPLRRMLEAVSTPDYIYMMNDSDSLCDKAELYEFWSRTLMAEAEDFNVPGDKAGLLRQRQRKIKDSSLAVISPKAVIAFQRNAASFISYDLTTSNMNNTEKIEHVMRTFGMTVRVAYTMDGYSSDTYLLEAAAGIKIGNIQKYRLDMANALNVPSVRICDNLVVYEGRSYVSVEAGKKRSRDLLWDAKYLEGRRLPVGVDNYGNTVVWDLDNHATPHMLICGATGSGKSVCIRSTIAYAHAAGIDDIIIFDPKYEFAGISMNGISVYNDISEIEATMKLLVDDMQRRASSGAVHSLRLVIFDEFADAVASARSGKELDIRESVEVGTRRGPMGIPVPKYEMKVVGREKSLEENLKMLLQKGRSLGFRIVAATQRASTKVITGDAKVNFPVQVCFRVPKAVDSKVVLDEEGAESLSGLGDGLMRSPEYMGLVRFQGFYKE